MTYGAPLSITAMHEFLVPTIPITAPMAHPGLVTVV
jgi:hypothetical protein